MRFSEFLACFALHVLCFLLTIFLSVPVCLLHVHACIHANSTTLVLISTEYCIHVLFQAVENIHYLWIGPVQVAVVLYLLHCEVGTAGLWCVLILLAVIGIHFLLELAVSKLR